MTVKYLAAQIFLAVAHLHENGIRWSDAKQANTLIMPDFTIRLIDIGDDVAHPNFHRRDFLYAAGTVHNIAVGLSCPRFWHSQQCRKVLVLNFFFFFFFLFVTDIFF